MNVTATAECSTKNQQNQQNQLIFLAHDTTIPYHSGIVETLKSQEMEFNIELLGKWVRSQRILLGITQEQLADNCGVALSTVRRLEGGQSIGLDNFIKISQSLVHQSINKNDIQRVRTPSKKS